MVMPDDNIIEDMSSAKVLGSVIHNRLTWESLVGSICNKKYALGCKKSL